MSVLKWLRLRSRPLNDNPPPRDDCQDVVNLEGRLAGRTPKNNYAELFGKDGTPVNSVARIIRVTPLTTVVHGEVFGIGDTHFEFNAGDGSTVSNPTASAVKAQGTLTLTGLPSGSDTFVVGPTTYTIEASPSSSGDVLLAATAAQQAQVIASAINGTDGLNTANKQASAEAVGSTVVITSLYSGASGDDIVLTESLTNATADGSGTLGGTTAGVSAPYIPVDITAYADKSQGTITLTGQPSDGDTITIGEVLSFVDDPNLVTVGGDSILIGDNLIETINNIISTINNHNNASIDDSMPVTAAGGGAGEVVVTHMKGGAAGDTLVFSESASNLTMDGSGNLGGTTAGSNPSVAEVCDAIVAAVTAYGSAGSGDIPFTATDNTTSADITFDVHGANLAPLEDAFAGTIAQQTAGVDGTPGILGCVMHDATNIYILRSADEDAESFTWRKVAHSSL